MEGTSSAQPPPIPRASIDRDAAMVIQRLVRHGFKAYLVGGCVRDLLLGVPPKDFDVATSARPRQIKRLFRNSRVIGRRFKLVHVTFGPHTVEVSTFRAPPDQESDDPYITRDNIFGDEVSDALRRDFTINGLFYDIGPGRVIDHVGGCADLEGRCVRTIGNAELRIREDPVRILRAAKFAGRLSLHLDPELRAAAVSHAADLGKAAPPRVLEEIYRLLSGRGAAASFRILEEVGAVQTLFPELLPLPESFYAALTRLSEESGGERGALSQALLLAVLCAPLVARALPLRDPEEELREILRPVTERLPASRRDLAGMRLLLAAQAHFLAPPDGRHARRLCSRDYYPEARHLRAVLGPLAPVEPDPLPLWEEFREGDAGMRPPARRRRRRRRRGGRGRQPLSGAPNAGTDRECPPARASSSAPAPATPPSGSQRACSNGDSSPA